MADCAGESCRPQVHWQDNGELVRDHLDSGNVLLRRGQYHGADNEERTVAVPGFSLEVSMDDRTLMLVVGGYYANGM